MIHDMEQLLTKGNIFGPFQFSFAIFMLAFESFKLYHFPEHEQKKTKCFHNYIPFERSLSYQFIQRTAKDRNYSHRQSINCGILLAFE